MQPRKEISLQQQGRVNALHCWAGSHHSNNGPQVRATDTHVADTVAAGEYESAHAFSHFANWLVPGRILVGRYPYVEPSRCRSREQGTQHMRQILGAGMTTFVSLQVGAEAVPRL